MEMCPVVEQPEDPGTCPPPSPAIVGRVLLKVLWNMKLRKDF